MVYHLFNLQLMSRTKHHSKKHKLKPQELDKAKKQDKKLRKIRKNKGLVTFITLKKDE